MRARWGAYLSALHDKHSDVTRSQIAATLEVPVSRVSQWLVGKRSIVAETAFDVGERLAVAFGWDTSGAEALFACGYTAELIDFLKCLSVDRAAGGHELAVTIYCWLPYRFLDFERAIASNLRNGGLRRAAMVSDYELTAVVDSRYLARYDARPQQVAALAVEAYEQSRTQEARSAIERSWIQRLRGRPNPTLDTRARHAENAEANAATLEVAAMIADLAGRSRLSEPTSTIPRAWRLLAEWAYLADAATLVKYSEIMPDPYIPHQARIARDEYEELWCQDQADSLAYDQWRGK